MTEHVSGAQSADSEVNEYIEYLLGYVSDGQRLKTATQRVTGGG